MAHPMFCLFSLYPNTRCLTAKCASRMGHPVLWLGQKEQEQGCGTRHVQKDKDGNVIFTATGTEHVTFTDQKLKDGSTLKIGWDANTG